MTRTLCALLFIGLSILVAWKWTTPGPVQPPLSFTEAEDILASQWSPFETHLFLLHEKGKLTIYDIERNTYRQIQTTANSQYNEAYSLFQSPDGKQVGVASFKHPHLVFEIYESASGRLSQRIIVPVAAKDIYTIQVDWHPSKSMLIVGYKDQLFNAGPLQAIDLQSHQARVILEKANRFAFSGSKLVILTGELRHRDKPFQLHVSTENSFQTTPLKLDITKGKIVAFATSSRGLYFTQRSVHNKRERITTSFWRNEGGHLKPAWNSAFEFWARYEAQQDEILPATDNEWAAVTIIFGTDGTSGGRVWCVNQNEVISLDNYKPAYYGLSAYGWWGTLLAHSNYGVRPSSFSSEKSEEIKAHDETTYDNFYFNFDVQKKQRYRLPDEPLTRGNWSWDLISPRLKHMAIFRKEKEIAPWQLTLRSLDWCR